MVSEILLASVPSRQKLRLGSRHTQFPEWFQKPESVKQGGQRKKEDNMRFLLEISSRINHTLLIPSRRKRGGLL